MQRDINSKKRDELLEDLEKKIRRLEANLDAVSPSLQELLTNQVYDNVLKRLLLRGKILIVIVAISTAVLGYSSYRQIVDKGTQKATEEFVNEVLPKLKENAYLQVTNTLLQITNDINSKLEQEMATIIITSREYANSTLKSLYEQIKATNGKVSTDDLNLYKEKALVGYALYGNYAKDKLGNKVFTLRNFAPVDSNPMEIPTSGSLAITTVPVLVKSSISEASLRPTYQIYKFIALDGTVTYTNSLPFKNNDDNVGTNSDTVTNETIGALNRGQKIRILSVHDQGISVWIKLTTAFSRDESDKTAKDKR